MKNLLTAAAILLGAVGLGIFFLDAYTSHRYALHITEMAGVDTDGTPIHWPTGEDPGFTQCSPAVYSLGFWVVAAAACALRLAAGRSSCSVQAFRGTE